MAYSAAAGAMLTGVEGLEAGVVYTDLSDKVLQGSIQENYTVSFGGGSQLKIGVSSYDYTSGPRTYQYGDVDIAGMTANAFWVGSGAATFTYASALASNVTIGPSVTNWVRNNNGFWVNYNVANYVIYSTGSTLNRGNFVGANHKFIGVKFQIGGQTRYGWIEISVPGSAKTVTIHGYAYEDTGASIKTGQTGSSNAAPTLTGLIAAKDFNENAINAAAEIIDSDVTFNDADGGDLDTGVLTVTGVRSTETISVSNQAHGVGNIQRSGNNIQVSDGASWTTFGVVDGTETGSGANLKITFNASSTPTNVDALIQRLTYQSSSQSGETSHSLTLKVTDGDGGDTGNKTISMRVFAENDAPTDINLSSLTIQENAGNAVVGDLSTTDPDNL